MSDPGGLPALAVALTVGAVIALVLVALRPRTLFVARVRGRGRGVDLRGQVPGHAAATVRDFVASLSLPPGASIRGLPDGDRFRLEFSRQVPASEHQRLRNFFYSRI